MDDFYVVLSPSEGSDDTANTLSALHNVSKTSGHAIDVLKNEYKTSLRDSYKKID